MMIPIGRPTHFRRNSGKIACGLVSSAAAATYDGRYASCLLCRRTRAWKVYMGEKPISEWSDTNEYRAKGKPTIKVNHAEFDDEAGIAWVDIKDAPETYLISIRSSENTRGRQMIQWLKHKTQKKIFAVSAVDEAFGFYEKMGEEGLMSGYSEDTVDAFFEIDYGGGPDQRFGLDTRF